MTASASGTCAWNTTFHLREVVVDRRMDDEAGRVDIGRTFEHVAVAVDLDQVRRRDLVVQQSELVEEEVVVGARAPAS